MTLPQPTPPPREPPATAGHGKSSELFRKEALEHHARPERQGALLRLSPAWVGWAYWLVLCASGVALLYAALGTVHEYASGPAIVRVRSRRELTAPVGGTVSEVAVAPGTRVTAGQRLVLLHDRAELAEAERIEREFELQLLQWMRDPGNEAARVALTGLRAQRELAQARLAERALYAPADGVISDVRVRPGQYLSPGEVALTWAGAEEGRVVTALLPGHARPFLRPGGTLRLELEGFRYEYRDLVIHAVSDELLGPSELRRFLGPDLADTVQLEGPVVRVEARLPSATFQSEGHALHYFDGMRGKAEARLRSGSLLVRLVPGLKVLFPPTP